ncbi:hypothetical protein ACOSQ3_010152 [Xanthoceras sorbifolium]
MGVTLLVEYSVPHPDNYTLTALCADVYMTTCSDMPHPHEKFKLEAKLAWTREYRLIEDDTDLQDIFLVFKARELKIIRFQMELLPLTVVPPADSAHDSYSVNQDMPNFVCISSCEEDNNEGGKKKAEGTVLGKRKFHVGISSNASQKKKKNTTVASSQPFSHPIASSQPLSQNAPTLQHTQSSTISGNLH